MRSGTTSPAWARTSSGAPSHPASATCAGSSSDSRPRSPCGASSTPTRSRCTGGATYLCLVGLLLAPRRRAALFLVVPAAAGLLWTHTRAAVLALAVGLIVLATVCRRAWPVGAAAATLVVGFAVISTYPQI